MRVSFSSLLLLGVAANTVVASNWFGTKAVYNKWHETELERWLSDHNIPYPTPADRKDLETLVKTNWDEKVARPYNDWSPAQLQSYLKTKGCEATQASTNNKNSLVKQVQDSWSDSADSASNAYGSVKDWIFDSWTESQLKTFLDKNGIPAPQPRKRDTLLATARQNYEATAQKINEYAQYPGSWLYDSWSESDLKEFCDVRGIPVPQPSTRDRLIATVRRNSRLASLSVQDAAASASSSAAKVKESLSDALLDSWSDSDIKAWADKNGIKVPQGSKRNELLALARKHRAQLTGDTVGSSAASAYGAATSKAGNDFAKATDDATLMTDDAFNSAIDSWNDNRLKAFLDARGVPVPQGSKRNELVKQVRLHKHKAATGYSAWTFDTWTVDNLKKYLSEQNNKAAKKAGSSRDDLVKAAQDNYASASKAGGSNFASLTSSLASYTAAAKDTTFDTWSDSDLKHYLDSYGIKTYQGSTTNELKALARRNAQYFRFGTTTPGGTIFAQIQDGFNWVWSQLSAGAAEGKKEAENAADKAKKEL